MSSVQHNTGIKNKVDITSFIILVHALTDGSSYFLIAEMDAMKA
jgi:hypothetical protein